jgi:hypothetical protein
MSACVSAVCVHRKFKGAIRMPNVGYGTNKKDRHVLPNGFKKVSTAWHGTPGGRGANTARGRVGMQQG